MKTIAVILPVNNQQMLTQADLDVYQSNDFYFEVSYTNTRLKELNTVEDVVEVTPLVLKRIKEAEKKGAAAIVVFAFGDVCVEEGQKIVSIPVMGLGRAAVQKANKECIKHFTVLPAQLSHSPFIEGLIESEGLREKFIPATHSAEMSPAESKNNPELTLTRLVAAAKAEINQKGVDTLTLACGSLVGVAEPLQRILRNEFRNENIKVIDFAAAAFDKAKVLTKGISKVCSL